MNNDQIASQLSSSADYYGAAADKLNANLAKIKKTPTTVKGTETKEKTQSVEPTGKMDRELGSYTTFGKDKALNPNVLNNVLGNTAPANLLSTSGVNYGRSSFGVEKDESFKDDNAQLRAKKQNDERVKKNQKADNPTAASQDPKKEIIEATMAADPTNISGTVQKALHSMMMIKMLDRLSSPAGIAAMAAAAMGGGLGGLARAVGTGAMLGGLSAAMPALQLSLPGSHLGALNLGMQGMISGNPVGVLAAASVAAAADTVATLRGVAIASTLEVVDSFMQDQLGVIPKLYGNEHIIIANDHIIIMEQGIGRATVQTLLDAGFIAGELAGAYLAGRIDTMPSALAGAVSGALVGGAVGGVLGNALGGAIGGAITGGVASIVDAGLTKLLGAPLGKMLDNATSILPNIGTHIVSNVAAHADTIAATAVSSAMQEATKTLGLAATGFKITNVFGPGLAEQVADLHDSMVAGVVKNVIAGAVEGAIAGAVAGAVSRAFPTTLVAYCNGVRITVSARVNPAQAAAVGAIAGAFSSL